MKRPKITDIRATTVTVPLEAPLRHSNGAHWGRFVRTIFPPYYVWVMATAGAGGVALFPLSKPDSGILLDDMFFADGGLVPTERFIATRVEAELAFVMKHRLSGPNCTLFDVLNATDFVVPALEILDTRVERVDPQTKATRKIFDTIADNAANAGIVLGGRPIRPLDADLRWIGALCYRNGQLEETGLAAGVLNHPATAVAWLANKIAPNGLSLEPGQVRNPYDRYLTVKFTDGATARGAGPGEVATRLRLALPGAGPAAAMGVAATGTGAFFAASASRLRSSSGSA